MIHTYQPDIVLLLGDIVYADISKNGRIGLDYAHRRIRPRFIYPFFFSRRFSLSHMDDSYAQFKSSLFYQDLRHYFRHHPRNDALLQSINGDAGIISVWDDHDYGINDGGAWHPKKVALKGIFQSHFGINPHSGLAADAPGIYGSYRFGPNKQGQLIILDCRSFKTPHFKLSDTESPTILGAQQWKWLMTQLQEPAELRLIAASIPVIPTDIYQWKQGKWKSKWKERWHLFGNEREQLLSLLAKSTGQSVILSGDWHVADISRIQYQGKEIVEITGGGWHTDRPTYKGYRGLRRRFKHEHSIPSVQADMPPSRWQNFGTVTIDWSREQVHLASYTKEGRIFPGYEYWVSF